MVDITVWLSVPCLLTSFQIVNVTIGSSRVTPRRGPVNIIFAVKGTHGFLNGSEVSDLLRNLTVVEFSFYLGYPVLQIAEREYLPAPGARWGWGALEGTEGRNSSVFIGRSLL